ncbi:hypothetical protein LCGC14_1212910 [marine sediment metagenome]|uniref:Uncharacterized protein n=1 Tax=marine sediment metagenome TaxID=412755 RepID=A0A0F9M0W5_9ZZZZ
MIGDLIILSGMILLIFFLIWLYLWTDEQQRKKEVRIKKELLLLEHPDIGETQNGKIIIEILDLLS